MEEAYHWLRERGLAEIRLHRVCHRIELRLDRFADSRHPLSGRYSAKPRQASVGAVGTAQARNAAPMSST